MIVVIKERGTTLVNMPMHMHTPMHMRSSRLTSAIPDPHAAAAGCAYPLRHTDSLVSVLPDTRVPSTSVVRHVTVLVVAFPFWTQSTQCKVGDAATGLLHVTRPVTENPHV